MGNAQVADCATGEIVLVPEEQQDAQVKKFQDREAKRQIDEAAKEVQRQSDLATQKVKDQAAAVKLAERQGEILARAKALAATSPELTVILELLGAL